MAHALDDHVDVSDEEDEAPKSPLIKKKKKAKEGGAASGAGAVPLAHAPSAQDVFPVVAPSGLAVKDVDVKILRSI